MVPSESSESSESKFEDFFSGGRIEATSGLVTSASKEVMLAGYYATTSVVHKIANYQAIRKFRLVTYS